MYHLSFSIWFFYPSLHSLSLLSLSLCCFLLLAFIFTYLLDPFLSICAFFLHSLCLSYSHRLFINPFKLFFSEFTYFHTFQYALSVSISRSLSHFFSLSHFSFTLFATLFSLLLFPILTNHFFTWNKIWDFFFNFSEKIQKYWRKIRRNFFHTNRASKKDTTMLLWLLSWLFFILETP